LPVALTISQLRSEPRTLSARDKRGVVRADPVSASIGLLAPHRNNRVKAAERIFDS
jgi:hypothetical protein